VLAVSQQNVLKKVLWAFTKSKWLSEAENLLTQWQLLRSLTTTFWVSISCTNTNLRFHIQTNYFCPQAYQCSLCSKSSDYSCFIINDGYNKIQRSYQWQCWTNCDHSRTTASYNLREACVGVTRLLQKLQNYHWHLCTIRFHTIRKDCVQIKSNLLTDFWFTTHMNIMILN
jgi:hypothetical protein